MLAGQAVFIEGRKGGGMDLNYLYFRQQVERTLAKAADNEPARRAHDGLARGYENEIVRLTGNRMMWALR